MKVSQRNSHNQETILVIHHDAAVLVLVRGILTPNYRVLLAANAEDAVRLAMLESVPMDLVLIGRDTPGVRNARELQLRLTSIRPNIGILSMLATTDQQVIRIRTLGTGKPHMADDLLTQVHRTLARRKRGSAAAAGSVCGQVPARLRKTAASPLVARASTLTQ